MDINIVMIEGIFYRSCRYLRLLKYMHSFISSMMTILARTRRTRYRFIRTL